MLAFVRRMNHHPHLTKAGTTSTTNNVGSNDEHTPSVVNTEKMFLLNGNLSQEPTTPCVLNTPNTCTKNATFFYEMPSSMHTTTLSGTENYFSILMQFLKLKNLKLFQYLHI
jgi:hypothetical protein